MTEPFQNLIEALREELKQYGEMLALLDPPPGLAAGRVALDPLQGIARLHAQAEHIHAARREREQRQRHTAGKLDLAETASLADLAPRLPPDYRPLVQALVHENNDLFARVQQRARQHHSLLNRAADLMQRLVATLVSSSGPATSFHEGPDPSDSSPPARIFDKGG